MAQPAVPTLLAIAEALGGRDGRVGKRVLAAARSRLGPRDELVLAWLVDPQTRFVPDCLIALPAPGSCSPEDELTRLQAVTHDQLKAELDATRDELLGTWGTRDAKAWLAHYHGALDRLWMGLEPLWRAAEPALYREAERVAMAIARGSVKELFLATQPPARIVNGHLAMPGCSARTRLSPAGVVVIPKLVGDSLRMLRAYNPEPPHDVTHLAYRCTWSLGDVLEDESGSVEALLGVQRARMLRQLDRPQSMTALAETLVAVPSAATYHAAALEASGLARRKRCGRHVFVHRTERGTALLALYERA
jgi:DNA-binding MarR family transcriptional regulator